MSRFTHVLACLYGLTAIGLLYCATISHRNGADGRAGFLYGAACLLATAIVHHAYHRDELRAALVRLDRATRPHDRRPAIDGVVAVALAAACCERWWTSAGADHDPANCTRKDQAA